jgi:23S rRNA (cytidine1920-2'-O)/16S rRNA (cytidine1409-2'-O)-methyltransferase
MMELQPFGSFHPIAAHPFIPRAQMPIPSDPEKQRHPLILRIADHLIEAPTFGTAVSQVMLFFQQFLETLAGCLFGDDIGVKRLGPNGPPAVRRLFHARLIFPNQPPVFINIFNPAHFSHLLITNESPWPPKSIADLPSFHALHSLKRRVKRLDVVLVERGLCQSREKAKRAIMAGAVQINGRRAKKSSDIVHESDMVSMEVPDRFVSRGGLKLEHALIHFRIDVSGMTAIDIGASTGGFTDCLLKRNAAKIYAVDVGHGQLAWTLRRDERVIVMEKSNARFLNASRFAQPFLPVDLVVIDCSFISLRIILAPAVALLKSPGKIVALIKPQFEAGKPEVDRGAGVISDPAIHQRVLAELQEFVQTTLSLVWRGVTESPLLGPAGNREFLVLLEKIG